jgi:hypothetical protein
LRGSYFCRFSSFFFSIFFNIARLASLSPSF